MKRIDWLGENDLICHQIPGVIVIMPIGQAQHSGLSSQKKQSNQSADVTSARVLAGGGEEATLNLAESK